MAKIGKAAMDEPQAQDPTAAAARRREDLKRAIEAGVLGPLRSTQEGVDPSLDKPEKKDEPDLDIEQPVDVPAQEDARSWEEAVVKMKKQKAERVAKPPKPKAPPNMERFIQSLLSEERVERSQLEEGIEQRRDMLEASMAEDPGWGEGDPDAEWDDAPEGVTPIFRHFDLLDRMAEEMKSLKPFKYSVNEQGLQLRSDIDVDYDDPQAIADAADDHAAQYIYKDIPGEDVPDAADLDYQDERQRAGPQDGSREMTYGGDGPGGEGSVYFYEDAGGGEQRGYWLRDDGSVVNVTNILFPPKG